jgi:hypothetical protein
MVDRRAIVLDQLLGAVGQPPRGFERFMQAVQDRLGIAGEQAVGARGDRIQPLQQLLGLGQRGAQRLAGG